MARAGRACWPAMRGAELSTSIARGRRTAAGRRGSTTGRPPGAREAVDGGGSGAGRDGMRPGGWRGRAGVEDDGGAAETSSTAGRGWATEVRSKMAVAAAMIDV